MQTKISAGNTKEKVLDVAVDIRKAHQPFTAFLYRIVPLKINFVSVIPKGFAHGCSPF